MSALRKWIARLIVLLAIIGIFFAWTGHILVLAADAPQPDFEFSETTKIPLEPGKPVDVFILNKTMVPVNLRLWISDFGFSTLDGKPFGQIVVLKDDAGNLLEKTTLAPGESKRLTLELDAAAPDKIKQGKYTAYLVAAEEKPGGNAIHRELESILEGSVSPTPLVEKWTLQAVHKFPFTSTFYCSPACTLPLAFQEGETVALDNLPSELGALVGEKVNPVIVKWTEPVETKDGIPHLPLVINNLKKPGAYTGTLDLFPDDKDAGVVEITLNATDLWIWPLIALVIGILLAMWAQWNESVGRKLSVLQQRLAEISPSRQDDGRSPSGKHGTKYGTAVAEFETRIRVDEKLADETKEKFKVFSMLLEADLDSRVEKLKKQIDALKWTPTPALDDTNKDYKAAVDELNFIEGQLDVWKAFGLRWAQLFETVNGFLMPDQTKKPKWPKIEENFPGFINTAKKEYWKGEQVKLTDLAVLDDKIKKAAILAGSWNGLQDEVNTYRGYIRKLSSKEMPDEYRKDLYTADRLINQAWVELWLAEDADDLKERTTEADIEQAEALIFGLYEYLIKEEGKLNNNEDMTNRLFAYLTLPTEYELWLREFKPNHLIRAMKSFLMKIRDRVTSPEDHVLQARKYKRARLMREAFFFLIAFAIAVITGMTALYVGKNFGSPQDYIGILIWGLVTKGVLEVVNSGLAGLRSFAKG